jgi:hypothetical protein
MVAHVYRTKLHELCKEKDFEMPIVELLDYKIVLECSYRSPDGIFHIFLKKKKIGTSNSKKKSDFIWRLEHNFMEDRARL